MAWGVCDKHTRSACCSIRMSRSEIPNAASPFSPHSVALGLRGAAHLFQEEQTTPWLVSRPPSASRNSASAANMSTRRDNPSLERAAVTADRAAADALGRRVPPAPTTEKGSLTQTNSGPAPQMKPNSRQGDVRGHGASGEKHDFSRSPRRSADAAPTGSAALVMPDRNAGTTRLRLLRWPLQLMLPLTPSTGTTRPRPSGTRRVWPHRWRRRRKRVSRLR